MDVNALLAEFQKSFPQSGGGVNSEALSLIGRVSRFRFKGTAGDKESGIEAPNLIRRAFNFAEEAHKEQRRRTGEPYFRHSYETAMKLAEWRLDNATIAAGLLHDVAEDTPLDLENIKREFGDEIAFLVDGVTKLGHLK